MNRLLLLIIPLMLFGCGDSSAFQAPVSVPNGTGAQVRSNMNNALQAITTEQSGASAPATTYPYQRWIDTSTTPPTERVRNAANTAWVVVGTVDTAYTGSNSDKVDGAHASATPGNGVIPVGDSAGRIAWGAKPAFRGALVYNIAQTGGIADFLSEAYDTDNIHPSSGATSTLTVPAGVTKVRITAQGQTTRAGGAILWIIKNGGYFIGSPFAEISTTGTLSYYTLNVASPVIPVTAGDSFQMGGTLLNAEPTGSYTWFAMEIIE
jgi:hypothetical protein